MENASPSNLRRWMGRYGRCFPLPIGPQKWPNCPMKGLWVWILGTQTPLCSAPRPKPSVGTPVGRVQDQDQDQDDEQEHVRSPKPANSCKHNDESLLIFMLMFLFPVGCKEMTSCADNCSELFCSKTIDVALVLS